MSNVATQEEAITLQLKHKPQDLRAAMLCVVELAVTGHPFWPDEQVFAAVPAQSRNCIGNAFKVLFKAGVIEQTGNWRRSRTPAQKGRRIWAWRMVSEPAAKLFLKACAAQSGSGN